MTPEKFLESLQNHTSQFAKAVATDEGEWIVKGFVDIHKRVYTISIDTKIISKVLELLLFPMLNEFSQKNGLKIELSPQQNFYPDLTFVHEASETKFAVDIKSTYRIENNKVNGMTLGAFTGYFRNRKSSKNILYPYGSYSGHYALGVIYSKCDDIADECQIFTVDQINTIPSVIKDFQFFVQPKYKIASYQLGSGNTKNIGSVTDISSLMSGSGSFSELGEDVYDDYWMFYLTNDMAKKSDSQRPYKDLKSYFDYKTKNFDSINKYKQNIIE